MPLGHAETQPYELIHFNRSVVTRFSETNVTQFFVQDGRRINVPTPFGLPGLPPEAGLSDDMCFTQPAVFEERGRFTEIGGWLKHIKQILTQPMVLTFSIGVDVSHQLSIYFKSCSQSSYALTQTCD